MATEPGLQSKIRYMDTADAYDLWSEVYDTDDNFLQALDTIEMEKLLPSMLLHLKTPKPWRVVDLGCGTGRNTFSLCFLEKVEIVALDLSPRMLENAQSRIQAELARRGNDTKIHFEVFDMLRATSIPLHARNADAIISTLVVEHIPLPEFFLTVSKILKPGGLLLLTNMHSEMGSISQAGFVDPKTGEKIRPKSYAHTVEATIEEAMKHGLEVFSNLEERRVTQELAPKLGIRANKWIGINVWFGGIFRRKGSVVTNTNM